MKFMYNVTGAERKRLVGAVSEIVGARTEYLGMPSCGYRVGSYEIDKQGTLTIPADTDGDAVERLTTQLAMKGFAYTAHETNEPVAEPEGAAESDTPPAEQDGFTVEVPLAGFTDGQLLNLEKLVASKASLIKKSLGVDALPIVRDGERLAFPWFHRELNSFEIQTYTHFIAALCDTAKALKSVTAKDKDVPSERFTFRIFLLRLGFAGAQYADERRFLYAKLSGDCAFPTTAKRDEHAARWSEIHKQRRAERRSNQAEADATTTEAPAEEQAPEATVEQPEQARYEKRAEIEPELLNQEAMEDAV